MEVTERVRELCEPVAADLGVVIFDVERGGGTLRVTIDNDSGLDLDLIAEATRRISRLLDEHDPVPGRYTLEVSSPGLERTLRSAEHFRWAVGREVSIKTTPEAEGERRIRGSVVAADDHAVTVETDAGQRLRLQYDQIERARTIFEWGSEPKPSPSRSGSRNERGRKGRDHQKGRVGAPPQATGKGELK